MNQKELLEIIRNGESSKVEFKREEVHPNSLAEEIVAFANFEGGIILIGVDDSGELIGCFRDDIDEFVVNVCRNSIRPSIIPVIESILVDGKKIVIVTIPRGTRPTRRIVGFTPKPLKNAPFRNLSLSAQFLRQAQIIILEIFHIFLWVKPSLSLTLNKIGLFSMAPLYEDRRICFSLMKRR